jgi:hypothetical protein
LLLVQVFFAHLLIASGIALGVLTGVDNIFTAPEFFGGADGRNWGHVLAHLVGGVVLALLSWLIGSLILLVTRKLIPTATVEARRV